MENFLVYKSSAGTGKTYTLSSEYLKIALSSKFAFKKILAVTFTNKAAVEMKERIVDLLKTIIDGNIDKELEGNLISELDLDNKKLKDRAATVLSGILHNYDDFSISTIDSFMYKIIRSFAFDLGLPLNFEVDLDTDALLQLSVNGIIEEAGVDIELTKVLNNYLAYRTELGKGFDIETKLFEFSRVLMQDKHDKWVNLIKDVSADDYDRAKDILKAIIDDFEDEINKISIKAVEYINKNVRNDQRELFSRKGYFLNYFENIHKARSYNTKLLTPNSWMTQAIKKSAKNACDLPFTDAVVSGLMCYYEEIQDLIAKKFNTYSNAKIFYKDIYPMVLLSRIAAKLDEIKEENEILPISDFNRLIANIVRKEDIPFIYERVGERYSHFLIDEFQDTSYFQWGNFLPLIENSLANGNFNLIVGDGKQSIYRFRGGAMEIIANLPNLGDKLDFSSKQSLIAKQQAINNNFEQKILKKNWRSNTNLIDFNNSFFDFMINKSKNNNDNEFLKKSIFNTYQHHTLEYSPKTKEGGLVCLDFSDNKDKGISSDEYVCERTLAHINYCKEKYYEIFDDSVEFPYKDILILTRANSKASVLAKYLSEHNTPVSSSESLLLQNSKEVNFIISIFKISNKPKDIIYMYNVLDILKNEGIITYNDNDIIKLTDKEDNTGIQIYIDNILKENDIDFSISDIVSMNIYEAIEYIIIRFDKYFNSRKNNIYITTLIENLYTSLNYNRSSIEEFLVFWEEKKDKLSISHQKGSNTIEIMTIHKSKGLDSKIVIFPWANFDSLKTISKGKLWTENTPNIDTGLPAFNFSVSGVEEIEELNAIVEEEKVDIIMDSINTVYVALTRAIKANFIITSKVKNDDSFQQIGNLLYSFVDANKGDYKYDAEHDTYFYGEENFYDESDKIEKIESENISNYSSHLWHNRMKIALESAKLHSYQNTSESIKYGNLIHYLLSKVNTISDVENVILEAVSDGVILKNESDDLKKEIMYVVNHPKCEMFFNQDAQILNEIDIIMPNNHYLRPDRLMILENKVYIVDYKTGKSNNSHKLQLEKYKSALIQLGYKNIESYLLYIGDDLEVRKLKVES